mgnify:CR=1 FL=1
MSEETKRKNKANKQKKQIDDTASINNKRSWTVWDRRNYELKNLQLNIAALKKSIAALERKIESSGISGYYSQNHDCMGYSNSVWQSCLKLALLKQLDDELSESKDE